MLTDGFLLYLVNRLLNSCSFITAEIRAAFQWQNNESEVELHRCFGGDSCRIAVSNCLDLHHER